MPFGLRNAPATLQRMMNNVMRDFSQKFVTVYFDDVCIYSRTLKEYLEHLRLMLQRCKEGRLKLRREKFLFVLQAIMEYFGYHVSACKILTSIKKVEAVTNWPVPTTQKEYRSFVQFCSFFAKLIHHFSDWRLH
jgi:hypothetical protein